MQINSLKLQKKKSRKRIGRGGKKGTYSGKGMKGQRARSGAKINPLKEGGRSSLLRRMKKIGGFKSLARRNIVFSLALLDKKFSSGDTVSKKTLVEKGLLRKSDLRNPVKILSVGEIKNKLIIDKDILLSKAARVKIEKAE